MKKLSLLLFALACAAQNGPSLADILSFEAAHTGTKPAGWTFFSPCCVSLSQSSAEYHSMAFRSAPNAVVIGSTTAGADGNVSSVPLPGGLNTMISGIGVFYPDKRPTQRVGIVPDREVKPTIAGIRAGRDEVLEAGIRQILGPDVPAAVIEKIARK